MIIDPWGLARVSHMLAYFLQSPPLDGIAPTLWTRKQRLRETVTCCSRSGLSESRVCSGVHPAHFTGETVVGVRGGSLQR